MTQLSSAFARITYDISLANFCLVVYNFPLFFSSDAIFFIVEITFKVGDIDYDKTIDKFLPDIMKILQEGEGTNIIVRKAVSAKPELAMKLIKGVVSAMSQSQKDALTVKFLNMKAADICRKLNQYTSTSGLDLVLTDAVAFKK